MVVVVMAASRRVVGGREGGIEHTIHLAKENKEKNEEGQRKQTSHESQKQHDLAAYMMCKGKKGQNKNKNKNITKQNKEKGIALQNKDSNLLPFAKGRRGYKRKKKNKKKRNL